MVALSDPDKLLDCISIPSRLIKGQPSFGLWLANTTDRLVCVVRLFNKSLLKLKLNGQLLAHPSFGLTVHHLVLISSETPHSLLNASRKMDRFYLLQSWCEWLVFPCFLPCNRFAPRPCVIHLSVEELIGQSSFPCVIRSHYIVTHRTETKRP